MFKAVAAPIGGNVYLQRLKNRAAIYYKRKPSDATNTPPKLVETAAIIYTNSNVDVPNRVETQPE